MEVLFAFTQIKSFDFLSILIIDINGTIIGMFMSIIYFTMKINSIHVLILIFLFPASFYAQELDESILKKSTSYIENPNSKLLDSISKKFDRAITNFYENGYTVSTDEYKAPSFYYIQANGKQKSFNAYVQQYFKGLSNSFRAYFKIEVDWNGAINFIKLEGHTGSIDNIDFINFWKNIKANPATQFKIPIKTVIVAQIIKKNNL
ncbi:MAG: hypothetical protein AAF611_18085 [Bacteroidota bacterium]